MFSSASEPSEKMAEALRKRDEIRDRTDRAWELDQHGDAQREPPPIPETYGPRGGFVVKDSGQREQYDSGMVRDTAEGKTDYTLVLDGPMFERWAEHLTKGAVKYAARNWMKAAGDAELERFKQSALRHFLQWFRGDVDEDHASAVFFNINGAEFVKVRNQALESIKDQIRGAE